MVRLIFNEDDSLPRFLFANKLLFEKPVKYTYVLLAPKFDKFHISYTKMMDFMGCRFHHTLKQHKVNGKNIGYGEEFDKEYLDKKFDMVEMNYTLRDFFEYCVPDEYNPFKFDKTRDLIDKIDDRTSKDYDAWKKSVLLRDKVCQCCGVNKHLHVHHIFGFKKYPELRHNKDNGIVLCKWCHEKYHSLYGKKNPNPVTFSEYMNKYGRG